MHPVLQNIFISFMHPVAVSDAAAPGEAVAVLPPAVTADPSCPYCDGTGDVHTIDGEWRGRCTCPAGVWPGDPIRAASQGAFEGSDIALDERDIAGHAANQRSEPGKAGVLGSNPKRSTTHADQLQQLADLIADNNASCEDDDVPEFLRRARA